MFIIGNLLIAVATVIDYVLLFFMWIVVARAVLSWVNPDPYNPIVRFLYSITEPVMLRVRQMVPMSGIGLDISPIIVILAIVFLQEFLVKSLAQLALQLQ
jgi:YggT family protein